MLRKKIKWQGVIRFYKTPHHYSQRAFYFKKLVTLAYKTNFCQSVL